MRIPRWALSVFLLVAWACARDSRQNEGRQPAERVLDIDTALDRRAVLANESETLTARIRIAPAPARSRARPVVNLALVVDTSGSMEGQAIEDAKKASQSLVDELKDGDRLAVVAFDSRAETLAASSVLDSERRLEIKKKISEIRARGTTDMESGLRNAISEVSAHVNSDGVNRIVLLGDGIPNDEGSITSMVTAARASGISITALGLGHDYNESLMGTIAKLSGGKFHYIKDSSKVAEFFKDEVLRLDNVYARNAELELVAGPGVTIERVLGQANSGVGRRVRVPLGDLSRGEKRELYVRFKVSDRNAGANVELYDALLHYDTPGHARGQEREFVSVKATASKEDVAATRNDEITLGAAFASAAATTIEAIDLARAGQRARAIEILIAAAKDLERIAESHGSQDLKQEAEKLRGLATDLPQPTAAPAPPQPAAQAAKLRAQHDEAFQRLH